MQCLDVYHAAETGSPKRGNTAQATRREATMVEILGDDEPARDMQVCVLEHEGE